MPTQETSKLRISPEHGALFNISVETQRSNRGCPRIELELPDPSDGRGMFTVLPPAGARLLSEFLNEHWGEDERPQQSDDTAMILKFHDGHGSDLSISEPMGKFFRLTCEDEDEMVVVSVSAKRARQLAHALLGHAEKMDPTPEESGPFYDWLKIYDENVDRGSPRLSGEDSRKLAYDILDRVGRDPEREKNWYWDGDADDSHEDGAVSSEDEPSPKTSETTPSDDSNFKITDRDGDTVILSEEFGFDRKFFALGCRQDGCTKYVYLKEADAMLLGRTLISRAEEMSSEDEEINPSFREEVVDVEDNVPKSEIISNEYNDLPACRWNVGDVLIRYRRPDGTEDRCLVVVMATEGEFVRVIFVDGSGEHCSDSGPKFGTAHRFGFSEGATSVFFSQDDLREPNMVGDILFAQGVRLAAESLLHERAAADAHIDMEATQMALETYMRGNEERDPKATLVVSVDSEGEAREDQS